MCVVILTFTTSAAKKLSSSCLTLLQPPPKKPSNNKQTRSISSATVRNHLFGGLNVIFSNRLWINLLLTENWVRNAQKPGYLSHWLLSMCCICACSGLKDVVPKKYLLIAFLGAQGCRRYTVSSGWYSPNTFTAVSRPFFIIFVGSWKSSYWRKTERRKILQSTPDITSSCLCNRPIKKTKTTLSSHPDFLKDSRICQFIAMFMRWIVSGKVSFKLRRHPSFWELSKLLWI